MPTENFLLKFHGREKKAFKIVELSTSRLLIFRIIILTSKANYIYFISSNNSHFFKKYFY